MITTDHTKDSVRVNQLYVITALMQNKNTCLTIYKDIIVMDIVNPISSISITHKNFHFDEQGLLEKTEEYEKSEIQAYNAWKNEHYGSGDNNESEDFEE